MTLQSTIAHDLQTATKGGIFVGPQIKIKPGQQEPPFHPGVNRKREGIYVAADAHSIAPPTGSDEPMSYNQTANALVAMLVITEWVIFYLLFGKYGLLAILISTVVYTGMDARTRTWLKSLLGNNSAGSGGYR